MNLRNACCERYQPRHCKLPLAALSAPAKRRLRRRCAALLLVAAWGVALRPAKSEDICHITDMDAFLDKCPTKDPALGKILNDFVIEKDTVPVTFGPSSCVEPVSTMPIAQYTDQLALLQTLRTIYYLDRDRCGHLPWTALSLYDWLKTKVGGFNIDSSATGISCCGILPGGRPYINLDVNNDSNRQFHRTSEGVAEYITGIMHEARHVDGFPHVSCCPSGPGACDQVYDETNLSPYGIQYWLERAFLDGTLHTGWTCLSATRQSDFKAILRSGANDRPTRFCSNPPPPLTDANNPQPPCNSSCATTVTCVGPASGIPPAGGPPHWWGTSPPEPVYYDKLDDPRWAGAAKITYGDGTGEKAELRALHDSTFLYLSWRALVAPASVASQNTLFFGYRQAGGGDVIVQISLTDLSTVTDSASHLTLAGFLRNPNGTQGAAVALPAEISTTARVWVDTSPPGSWAVQLQMPLTAFETTCGRFKLWYELLVGTPTMPVASYTWPRSGAEIDGGTPANPHPSTFPDPAAWHWFHPSTGPADSSCAVGGVSLDYNNIGTKNTPASNIKYSAQPPFPSNTFFARPTNHSGTTIPAGAITATFRLANWGSVPGNWEQGVSPDELWATIPGGANVATAGAIPDGTTADDTNEAHFDWTVADPDLTKFTSGERRPHQCMLVELKSSAAPGVTFTNASVYRNMDLVSASTFRRDAVVSIKGLTAISPQPRDVYIFVETDNMPARVVASRPPANLAASASISVAKRPPATYRVHVYYDTGKTITLGGTVRPVLRYQTSFGYIVNHEGDLEGWRHSLTGGGLVELAPGWYKIPVPNQGSTTLTTEIQALEPGPWAVSLHLGANWPIGSSRHRYDGRWGGGVDLEYHSSSSLALELFAGRDELAGRGGQSDLTVLQLSIGAKAYFLSGNIRPFVLFGAGAYDLNPGTWEAGGHLGAGVQLDIAPRLALEGTIRYNKVLSGAERMQFATAQAGVHLRF